MMGNKFIQVAIALVIGVVVIPIIISVLGNSSLTEANLTAYPGARSLLVIIPLGFIAGLLWYAMKSMGAGKK